MDHAVAAAPQHPTVLDWQERVRSAHALKTPLRIRGGGSKDFYGVRLGGELLETRGYSGIVNYEPSELVVTVRSGTPLLQLEQILAERGQCLAFEPPHFGASQAELSSWMWAIGIGIAVCSVGPSLWLRQPVMIASCPRSSASSITSFFLSPTGSGP